MGNSAKFNYPIAISFDEYSQSLLVSDYSNSKLRRVRLNGEVTTVCDVGKVPIPIAVAVTSNQSILVTCTNNKLYKIAYLAGTQQYEAVVVAGTGKAESVDGGADSCSFNNPYGIALHEASNTCFISDFNSGTIRKVSFALPVV